jgi:hypothetical protein
MTSRPDPDRRGLFDSTHLHFYTWEGGPWIAAASGFRVGSVRCSGVPGLAFPRWDRSLAARTLEWLSFQRVFGRQCAPIAGPRRNGRTLNSVIEAPILYPLSCILKRDSRKESAMTVIEIPDSQATALKAKAAAQGLTLKAWLGKLAEEAPVAQRRPLKSGRGMLAKYGPAPSAEEIDENRKDMFRGFGED